MSQTEKPQQMQLFDLATVPKVEVHKRRYWYYLTRWRNSEMCVGFADDGAPLWAEHDTRGNSLKPYLFNNWSSADKAKKNLGEPAEVKRYEYSYR